MSRSRMAIGERRGLAEALRDAVSAAAPEAGRGWLGEGWPDDGEGCLGTPFRVRFAGARRRLGDGVPGERELPEPLSAIAPARRPLHLLGRVALIARAAELLSTEALVGLVYGLFQRGDTLERCAALCALPLLPDPAAHLETARLGTRNYVREVFEALAVDNPYPALHFPDDDFNQLVLKALFMGVALAGVGGVAERNNDELRRMVADFVRERRAADRPVPDDVYLILERSPA